jgi:transcriptional regulator with XRE-family HTH domain
MPRKRTKRYPTRGIGANLRRLRDKRGMPLRVLARETGRSIGAIHNIESGTTRNPDMSTVQGIARALGVSVAKLVEG